MRVQVEGKELQVKFQYSEEWRTTVALITDLESGEVHREFAICNKKDKWDKLVGRRIALGRAIARLYPKDIENYKEKRWGVWKAIIIKGVYLLQKGVIEKIEQSANRC